MRNHWYSKELADKFSGPVTTEKTCFYVEMMTGNGRWEAVDAADNEEDLIHYRSNGRKLRIRQEVTQTTETFINKYKDL